MFRAAENRTTNGEKQGMLAFRGQTLGVDIAKFKTVAVERQLCYLTYCILLLINVAGEMLTC